MKKNNGRKTKKPSTSHIGHDLPTLLERGSTLLQSGQPEIAKTFLLQALELSPNSTEALDLIGEVFVDLGDYESAKIAFEKSVQLAPDEIGTKWMFLGQLSNGKNALKLYEKGFELLQRDQSTGDPLRVKQMSKAKVAIAELYMTDLCMEEDAEKQCELAISLAEQYDPQSLEVYQTKASMRMSQSRPEEARNLLLFVASSLSTVPYDEREVPFEFCVQTCRLLVELNETERAKIILESLLREDDENIEIWILLGHCHVATEVEVTLECWERAEEILQMFLASDPRDELFLAQLAHVRELIKQEQERNVNDDDEDL